MLSLSSTHIILHYHRKVHYHHQEESNTAGENDAAATLESGDKTKPAEPEPAETACGLKTLGNLSNTSVMVAIAALVVSMIFFLAGVLVETFEVTSTRGELSETISYSIASIGHAIPGAYVDPSHTGTRFIQFMWFFLGIATPILCSVFFVVLYAVPSLSKPTMEMLFTAAEITFAWRCVSSISFDSIVFDPITRVLRNIFFLTHNLLLFCPGTTQKIQHSID